MCLDCIKSIDKVMADEVQKVSDGEGTPDEKCYKVLRVMLVAVRMRLSTMVDNTDCALENDATRQENMDEYSAFLFFLLQQLSVTVTMLVQQRIFVTSKTSVLRDENPFESAQVLSAALNNMDTQMRAAMARPHSTAKN